MMSKKQSIISISPNTQITDQEINQCMEFCAMYNILYSMHQFPIPLKNIDQKRKIKISKFQKSTNKTQHKKPSKFEKPKITNKQRKNQELQKPSYQPSQVQNYNYQTQDIQEDRRQFIKGDQTKSKINQSKKIKNSPNNQGPSKQIDLMALVSQLAIGSNSHKDENNNFSVFNKNNQEKLHQSRYYQNDFVQKNQPQNSARSLYFNEEPRYNKKNQISNPYSKISYENPLANRGMFDLNSFMGNNNNYSTQNQIQSPYSSQLRGFNNLNPYDASHNLSRKLFSQTQVNQYMNPLSNFNQLNKITPASQNPIKYNKYAQKIQNQLNQPSNQKTYQTQNLLNYNKIGKLQMDDERTNFTSQYSPSNLNRIQSQYPTATTPSKNQNFSHNRSVSPLGNSSSCRNFFIQSPRQVSVDRSGVSRSKSRRKEKPGGSKSFYQPSLSGRKVVLKQQQRDQTTYQRPRQFSQQNMYMHNKSGDFRYQNREEQEQNKEQIKKMNNGQYPRMTGQTDFSGTSGWQQRNNPQKSTKSQQVINHKDIDTKKANNSQLNNKNQRNSPKLKHEIIKKQLNESEQSQNEIELDDLQMQMQKLNASRRKVPRPIQQIDLSSAQKQKSKTTKNKR